MTCLFEPISIGGTKLANRIVVSPMCQFAAKGGLPGYWHIQHLGSLSLSGAGLLMLESTAVSADGRISHGCLGLYSDHHEQALAKIVEDICHFSPIQVGIQLAHSGRKGSSRIPWDDKTVKSDWITLAPSALPFGDQVVPNEASVDDLRTIVQDYRQAARRAVAAGFSVIELHAAHGYLLHQFLSPLTNCRSDAYGGDQSRRMQFPLEVFHAIRAEIPNTLTLGVRVSGTDWHPDGIGVAEAVDFGRALDEAGADYLCLSSGGIVPKAIINVQPSYQVPFASVVKSNVSIPVMAVGMIADPSVANAIVANGEADLIALARAFLADPRWAWRAAKHLGVNIDYPVRYKSAHPRYWSLAQ